MIDHKTILLSTSDPEAQKFNPGERVSHMKFGEGRITAVEGAKLTVDFETVGTKRVIASFVERVSDD